LSTQTLAPTRHEMQQQLRRSAPTRVLFWPGKDWLEVTGPCEKKFFFRPNLGGRLIPDRENPSVKIPGDGRLVVSDIYEPILDSKHNTRGQRVAKGGSADEVVLYFCEQYGADGITWLRDGLTPSQEADEIADAERRYARTVRGWAEQERQTRDAFIENWRKQPGNAGRPISNAPAATTSQRRAIEILDALAGVDEYGAARGKFVCEHEGYDTDDPALFARHMKASHATVWEPEAEDEKPAASAKAGKQAKG
jgi:hypothetical protein